MLRKIITIDQDKCNGCGLCITACHENAIVLENGKATLLREDYCDGLGDCLPACPTNAITFEEREAAPYDEAAVKARQEELAQVLPCGCPGSQSRSLKPASAIQTAPTAQTSLDSQLRQWPVQIKLVPENAPYFAGADLLIAADCSAYAYASFHDQFIRGRITLIGCPKLDDTDYSTKLTNILKNNDIRSVTVVRMEVPCCGGIEQAVQTALKNSGKFLPSQVITISTEGQILV